MGDPPLPLVCGRESERALFSAMSPNSCSPVLSPGDSDNGPGPATAVIIYSPISPRYSLDRTGVQELWDRRVENGQGS